MSTTAPSPTNLMDVERRYAHDRDRSALHNEVRERYGLSETRWAQLVNAALQDGSAFEVDPVTAGVLARRVAARQRSRRTLATYLAVRNG